jgi:LPS sulfotransferase NodH
VIFSAFVNAPAPESVADGWDQFGPLYDHPPFDGIPRVYLIAASARTGSHYLAHLLFNTGALGSPLEYFNPSLYPKWQRLLDVPDFRDMFLQLARRRTSPNGWFGAIVHWRHFSPMLADAALMEALGKLEFIRLTRGDVIGRAISFVIARQTGAWHSFHAIKNEPHYDFAAIKEALKRIENDEHGWREFFAAEGIDPLAFAYEEVVADPAATVDRVCAHLGVTAAAPAFVPPLLPRRQSNPLKAEWKERFLADLARSP